MTTRSALGRYAAARGGCVGGRIPSGSVASAGQNVGSEVSVVEVHVDVEYPDSRRCRIDPDVVAMKGAVLDHKVHRCTFRLYAVAHTAAARNHRVTDCNDGVANCLDPVAGHTVDVNVLESSVESTDTSRLDADAAAGHSYVLEEYISCLRLVDFDSITAEVKDVNVLNR